MSSRRGEAGLPDAPSRETFKSEDEFEEAMGYWQGHVGKIRRLYARAMHDRALKASQAK